MTLFLWEGVCYYLEPEAVAAVLDTVRDNRHPETAIAFDYALALTDANLDRLHGARAFRATWEQRRTGEPFLFVLGEGELTSWLEERGFRALEHLDSAALAGLLLRREDGSTIGPVCGFFGFVLAAAHADNRGALRPTRE